MASPRSKTLATWLALSLGAFGAHRFYLRGRGDWLAWCCPWPTLIGLIGVWRMRTWGQDDPLSWVLIPLLGLMLCFGMLSAILIGLCPDEVWAQRHRQAVVDTAWAPVFGVILALLLGGTVLMGTIAFGGQKYFEWQQLNAVDTEPPR